MAPQKEAPNGDTNGADQMVTSTAPPPERVGPQQMIDRREYIRLLQQALRRMGFTAVAERLERESGIQMQPDVANKFHQAVLSGSFDEALALLPELTNNDATLKQARFLILQEKFREQVNRGDTSAAVDTLRQNLGPLQVNQQELKRLSGYLLQTADDASNPMLRRGPWDLRLGHSREQLIQALQHKLPPALLIPEGRLEALIEQAVQSQIAQCICHNCPGVGLSLFSDYSAGIEQLPSRLHRALEEHTDEVWHIQFSHRGDRLASASKDLTAIVWSVRPDGEARLLLRLAGHPLPVTHLSWSPDDSKLLTCSGHQVRLWDARTGECLHTAQHHRENTSACAWFPDGQHFLTGGIDKRIFMCDLQARVLRHWTMKERVNDLALSVDASVIICVIADRYIELMRLNDHVPVTSIGDEASVGPSAITSISLTPDGEYLLANLRSHTGHLWRVGPIARRIAKPVLDGSGEGPYGLAPEEEGDEEILDEPVMEYHAGENRVGRYVIRSCIGGHESAFVASGSEDCRVYIWHRDTGTRLAQLEGHSGTVNGVAWNPAHPHMLASASDDKTICIWMAPIMCDQLPSSQSNGTSHGPEPFPVL